MAPLIYLFNTAFCLGIAISCKTRGWDEEMELSDVLRVWGCCKNGNDNVDQTIFFQMCGGEA